jgi:hypothetical protein
MANQRSPDFWTDVFKIALGIFFGSVLTSIFGAVVGIASWNAFLASLPPPPNPNVATVEQINELILDYKAMTADPGARELQKAEAAESVARAFLTRKDKKSVQEWKNKAKRHEDASTAGKKTGPVK